MTDLPPIDGRTLRRWRRHFGLTQAAAAKLAGANPRSWQNWEQPGQHQPQSHYHERLWQWVSGMCAPPMDKPADELEVLRQAWVDANLPRVSDIEEMSRERAEDLEIISAHRLADKRITPGKSPEGVNLPRRFILDPANRRADNPAMDWLLIALGTPVGKYGTANETDLALRTSHAQKERTVSVYKRWAAQERDAGRTPPGQTEWLRRIISGSVETIAEGLIHDDED